MNLLEIEKLFSQGRYLEVRLLTEQFTEHEDHLREKQLYALALSKSGAAGKAEFFFKQVYDKAPNDPENAGIMGGILKELFRYTHDQHYAVEARKIYHDNFNITGHYYTGINAASMLAITGRLSAAREIAGKIISSLPSPSDFWEIMTLAEAKLLLKQTHEAVELYNQGRKLADKDWGKINIIYKQLWMMNHYFPIPNLIIKAYRPPKIGVFIGHMIDREGGSVRFPKSIEAQVKSAIVERIKLMDIQIGYCSLACGADILFAEALTEACGDVNIYLPFPKKDFLETSVRFAGQEWVDRYEALEKKWPVRLLSQEQFHGNNDLFALLGRSLMGSSILRAQMTHSDCYLLTVLSSADAQRKEGGTRDMLKLWPNMERYMNIDPSTFITNETQQAPSASQVEAPPTSWRTLYFCCADFPHLSSVDSELIKIIDKHRSEFQDELIHTEVNSGKMTIGLSSSYGVIRLTQMIIQDYKNKTGREDYRSVFHAGVANVLSENGLTKLEGEDHEMAKNAVKYAVASTLMCSSPFATSLILDPGEFTFHHAGTIEKNMEMYTLEIGGK